MMAYLIVGITLVTMIFGIIAYSVYKMREAKRAKIKNSSDTTSELAASTPQEKYLFFEQKELIL